MEGQKSEKLCKQVIGSGRKYPKGAHGQRKELEAKAGLGNALEAEMLMLAAALCSAGS